MHTDLKSVKLIYTIVFYSRCYCDPFWGVMLEYHDTPRGVTGAQFTDTPIWCATTPLFYSVVTARSRVSFCVCHFCAQGESPDAPKIKTLLGYAGYVTDIYT